MRTTVQLLQEQQQQQQQEQQQKQQQQQQKGDNFTSSPCTLARIGLALQSQENEGLIWLRTRQTIGGMRG